MSLLVAKIDDFRPPLSAVVFRVLAAGEPCPEMAVLFVQATLPIRFVVNTMSW